ncbi:TonB-dependent siderophore receptor [Acinetobacter sp. ESL0695]|uniref:TonB-dependent receptor family protein n=1 Tax=Acinetobacter sp. ESL0695 TaxID=2983215 RepID=UPI0023F39688|nr:TonB-dependent siderophore receptor [Acinetobacter sp. ESL0695]WEV49154.1 TonB-dependent siderophore receptor [Acinetobacter sp. ESL0695]
MHQKLFFYQRQFRYSKTAFATLCILLGVSASIHAQEDGATPPVLNTIQLRAQGNWLEDVTAKKVFEHPGARTIIDRKQLDETASTTLKDALKQVPGIQVQDNAGTAGSDLSLSFGVRGLTSRFSPRSTVLMDGVPLAFAPYGQPQLSLAPTSLGNISSIDVIRGAGSVRFGPQNVGGIINFNTREIPSEFKGSVGLTTEFAKNGNVKLSPNAFLGTTFENGLGVALMYSGTQGDGYRDDNDHNNINDVILKTAYRFTDTDKLEFSLHRYDAKAGMPGGLTPQQYAVNPDQSIMKNDFFEGHRTDGSLKYTHQDDVNTFEVLAYHTDTYRNAVMENQAQNSKTKKLEMQLRNAPRTYKVSAIEPRFSHAYAIGHTNNEISVGYRYLYETSKEYIGRSAFYAINSPVITQLDGYSSANGKTTAHAIYLDNRTDIGRWSITPGVRFESIKTTENFNRLNADNTVKNSITPVVKSNEVLPNFSVKYAINDQWNVFANYGISFGPQQYSQMAKIDGDRAVSQTEGLRPEKAKNYEIGTHYLGHGLQAELTAFYIDFNQELKRSKINGVEEWSSLGATRHAGFELGVNYDFGQMYDVLQGLSAYSNLTYTHATAAAGVRKGKDIPLYSRWVANLGLGYKVNQWTINTDLFAQSSQVATNKDDLVIEDDKGRFGRIHGYTTTAVRVGYDFNQQLKGLKVAAGIKNVFDTNYFTRSSDSIYGKYEGQPRTVFLQTSLDF